MLGKASTYINHLPDDPSSLPPIPEHCNDRTMTVDSYHRRLKIAQRKGG
jgi:hypothetical protein